MNVLNKAFCQHSKKRNYENLDTLPKSFSNINISHSSSSSAFAYNNNNNSNNNKNNASSSFQTLQGQNMKQSYSDSALHQQDSNFNQLPSIRNKCAHPVTNRPNPGLTLSRGISIGSIHLIHANTLANSSNEFLCEHHQNEKVRVSKQPKHFIYFIAYILIYVLFLMFGSFCFHIIESPVEQNYRGELKNLRKQFLIKYPEILGKYFPKVQSNQVKNKELFGPGNCAKIPYI